MMRFYSHLLKNLFSAKLRQAGMFLSGGVAETYELGVETPIQTFYDGKLFDPLGMRSGLKPIPGIPASGLPPHQSDLSSLLLNAPIQFTVDPSRSFFGDCLNVVDVPQEKRLDKTLPPFGWSGDPLLGGYAITASSLVGSITLGFGESHGEFVGFELNHGNGLIGSDSVLSAPDGYSLSSKENSVQDAWPISRGKLDKTSGRIHDFHYNVRFWNSAIEKLLAANPNLSPPDLLFPGLPHAGHAMAWITVNTSTKRLEFSVAAMQFLPLGTGFGGLPLTFPNSESMSSHQKSFKAQNSSLHPFILITAVGPEAESFKFPKTPVIPSAMSPRKILDCPSSLLHVTRLQGKKLRLTCLPTDTNFGDDFALNSKKLGGGALAQSPLFGEVEIQCGTVVDNYLPFTIRFMAPSKSFDRKFDSLLTLLPPGTIGGLVGMCGCMNFPKVTFHQRDLSLSSDPYKPSVGVVSFKTGLSAPMVLRKYLFQNVMKSLLMVEPRTPTDSFAYLSHAKFSQSSAEKIIFTLSGENFIPYPKGYAFPMPNGGIARIDEGSYLRPFINLFAIETEAFVEALPNIKFRSDTNHRGTQVKNFSFMVKSSAKKIELIELRCDEHSLNAIDCRARTAQVGNSTVLIMEFSLIGRNNLNTDCYCVLTITTQTAELQMISVDESHDFWVSGLCES